MTESSQVLIHNIIEYYRQCYQADNRGHRLWDVFSDKNELLYFLDAAHAQSAHQHGSFEVEDQYGSELEKNVAVYRREKTCLFGRYFLLGKLPVAGGLTKKLNTVCAPLLLYEAQIDHQAGAYTIKTNPVSWRWNSHLLALLSDKSDLEKKLSVTIDQQGCLDVAALVNVLSQVSSIERNYQHSAAFCGQEQLLTVKKQANQITLHLLDAACVLLTKRSRSSRGVIDELKQMSAAQSFGASMTALLSDDEQPNIKSKSYPDHVPGLLSEAQKRALYNAAQQQLSVLVGPPGTGKTYTIAGIILERFMQGESVLLVTQNESAVDVVLEKLVHQFGISADAINRSGGKHYHQKLKKRFSELLSGADIAQHLNNRTGRLKRAKSKLDRAERQFLRDSKKAVLEGEFMADLRHGNKQVNWFSRFKRWLIVQRFKNRKPLYAQLSEIHDLRLQREQLLSGYISRQYTMRLQRLLKKHRKQLVKFDAALRARTSQTQANRFAEIDYSLLLQALPIWLCSLSSLHRSLPLKKELFDLVIIDEATQCDVASCLPALFRARKALVVGDPKQLRHLSFLAADKQRQILSGLNLVDIPVTLNYRDHSMIDLAIQAVKSQEAVAWLDEHYRSVPAIIDFSNQHFYAGKLRIMTAKPVVQETTAIKIAAVENGQRHNGVNQYEIDAMITMLQQIIKQQVHLPQQHKHSIGLLSFFSEQADAIQKRLLQVFSVEVLMAHKIRAATPYGFQGEERDIMLLSCALDQDSPAGAYRYLNRADVFNVAITRARHLQVLFISMAEEDIPAQHLLHQYLQHVYQVGAGPDTTYLERCEHIKDLRDELAKLGIQTVVDYTVAGVQMDVVGIDRDHVLAFDLIGFPGEFTDVHHLDRYQIFERAQLSIFPLSFNAWTLQKQSVLVHIKQTFERLYAQSDLNVSITHQTIHWQQMLSVDPVLGKQTQATEYQLHKQGRTDLLQHLVQLIQVFCQFHWMLRQKLDPFEITSLRYQEQVAALFILALTEIQEAAVVEVEINADQLKKYPVVMQKLADSRACLQALNDKDAKHDELDVVINELQALNTCINELKG